MIDRRTFSRLLATASAALPLSAAATRNAAPASSARKIIKPKRLSEGDTVGLVLPASAVFEHDSINIAREQLELLGLKVVVAPHA